MSYQENRRLRAVGETADDAGLPRLPRAAVHSPTCLCGCALATYSMADASPPPAPELRGRAA